MSLAMVHAPFDLIDYLFSRGADPRRGKLVHYAVIREGDDALELVRRLVELGAPFDEIKLEIDVIGLSSPLHWAARIGKMDIVKYLLDKGADPLQLSRERKTPRFWAEKGNFPGIACILKEAEERRLQSERSIEGDEKLSSNL